MFCKQLQLHLSHNIDEVTVTLAVMSRPVKGTPNPDAKFTGSQFLLGLLRDEYVH